jgi:hypothetical protein
MDYRTRLFVVALFLFLLGILFIVDLISVGYG